MESTREWLPGIVVKVHPETWEVDVRLSGKHSSVVRRCKVIGNFLPEEDVESDGKIKKEKVGKVIVGMLNGFVQSPVAIPIHNVMSPGGDRKNYVYWSEHLNFKITIDRSGNLEISNNKKDLLQIRIQEKDGTIRIDTPGTSIVQKQSDESITINCKNANINASEKASVACGASSMEVNPVAVFIKAPTISLA